MATNNHSWKFVRIGGVDQVVFRNGSDITNIGGLDLKLWMALAMPTRGLEFDVKTADIIDADKDGRRTITYELNGMTRETQIADKSVKAVAKARPKADPADPLQAGAPIPGIITSVNVSVGTKVAKGDKLFTMEAMKMQTTIYAGTDGVSPKQTPSPFARRAVPAPEADPEMQMNPYSMTEILFLMQMAGIHRFHTEFSDHGGELGVFLFFQKPVASPA